MAGYIMTLLSVPEYYMHTATLKKRKKENEKKERKKE